MEYRVTQSFHTENRTEEIETEGFNNLKAAEDYFVSIKGNTAQGVGISTELMVFSKEFGDYHTIKDCWSEVDYEKDYGKLVIAFQHTGKGMNYSHKFLDCFWLDKYNSKNLSDNPDYRFKTWHYILGIRREDLEGLSYDDAVDLVEDDARLKLENSIDLDYLGIDFLEVGFD